jgi:hypothetical protein
MRLDEIEAQLEIMRQAARFDGAQLRGLNPADAVAWARDVDDAITHLITFKGELAAMLGGRLCAHCKRAMPASLAPQARYCRRSCRQRAFEARAIAS